MIDGEYKVIIKHNGESETKDVTHDVSKKPPGRPRKFKEDEKTEVIGVRLLSKQVRFLEKYGGQYGGKTGYVTHLVEKEMERLGVISKWSD